MTLFWEDPLRTSKCSLTLVDAAGMLGGRSPFRHMVIRDIVVDEMVRLTVKTPGNASKSTSTSKVGDPQVLGLTHHCSQSDIVVPHHTRRVGGVA